MEPIATLFIGFIAFLNANAGVWDFLFWVTTFPLVVLTWGSGYLGVLWRATKKRWFGSGSVNDDDLTLEIPP